ncbi:MAG: hypothetical protein B7Z73_06865 [Planctomycetia bacterium 21-64-5]|nr:MAG: hypothetical protein B7Z73_06865 [Planctomycetia bacterium 21-64-5]
MGFLAILPESASSPIQVNAPVEPKSLDFRVECGLARKDGTSPLSDAFAEFVAENCIIAQTIIDVRAFHAFTIVAPLHTSIQASGEISHFRKIECLHPHSPFCLGLRLFRIGHTYRTDSTELPTVLVYHPGARDLQRFG